MDPAHGLPNSDTHVSGRQRASSSTSPASHPLPQDIPGGRAYTSPPQPDLGRQTDIVPAPKPKKWWMPVVATVVIGGALAGAFLSQQSPAPVSAGNGAPGQVAVANQSQNILTVSGADVDQAATDQAISELRSGTPGPQLAALPDQVKQEILSGDRKFYRLPPLSASGSSFQPGDRISVDFNGALYGTYDLSRPVTLDMPLKLGDRVGVHCLSVAQGKSTIAVDMATVLNPVHSASLAPGQSEQFTVRVGGEGQNYQWFEQEAQSGNPVAEYGLGHMYQYGLGVAQDKGQAIHWYEQAAAQNYLDAKGQVQLLESTP